MADYDVAAEQVHNIAERMRSIMDMSDALKRLGSIDQAIKERDAAYANAIAAHDAKVAEITEMEVESTNLQKKLAADVAAAKAEVQTVLADAKMAADAIRFAAMADAKKTMDSARSDAMRVAESSDAMLMNARDNLAEVQREISAAIVARDAASDEYDAIKEKTDILRRAAQDILK